MSLTLMLTYPFMQRALIAGTLVSLCAALLGVPLVLKRYSMIGDGLSHVSFGALAIAVALGFTPLYFSIPVVILAAFFLLRLATNPRWNSDAAIAVMSASALAVGIIVISRTSGMTTDVDNYMFGSVLAMTWADVALSAVLSLAVLALFVLFYHKLFAVTFDESFSQATGLRVDWYNTLLAILTALTIVLGMRMMGAMLISLFVLLVYGTLFYGAFTKTWGYDWSFTWENLQYVFLKGEQIWNSIKYGLLASLGAALLAMVLAYIVQKKQVGLNKFLDFLAILPGAIPGMFLGIGFVLAFNGGWLSLTGTGAIMVLALLFWNLPTCYSAATAGLQQIGASVEDAALNLGANSFRSFKDVIIPLLKAPFLSGFVLSFLRSVTCLSVVIFLYAPSTTVGTISVMVLVQSGQWGEAAAFTVVLITIAFTVLRLAQWLLGRQGIKLEL